MALSNVCVCALGRFILTKEKQAVFVAVDPTISTVVFDVGQMQGAANDAAQ